MERVRRNQEEPVETSFMPHTKSVVQQLLELSAALTVGIGLLFISLNLSATYIYEGNQNLIDLTGVSGTTSLAAGDDQLSAAFNLDNSFTFYGTAYDSARMATNGCLHFGLGTGNINYNNYCGDYTPDPLPQYTNTLFPFWTDLIRDNGSSMLAKNFSDKTVFGWYNLREYNRSNSDNSFEVILWTNNTFEFRYGALDIIQHDVLIGEQGSTSQTYQYLFHDECNTGTTNVSGTCVNTDWNNTSSNTSLENGGSLYGVGSGNATDCSDPLNDASCSGYAAAYLTQQCNITQLHSESCPNYWQAYDDQQCDDDPQYAPFCPGYRQQESVAFFDDTNVDYGYEDPHTHDDPYAGMEFTDEEWYEIDVEEFGQEQVDEWYGDEVQFSNDGMVIWDSTHHEDYEDVDVLIDLWDVPQEESILIEEIYLDPIGFEPRDNYIEVFDVEELVDIFEFETLIREEIEREEIYEETFETFEELEEWFEEEMAEHEEVYEERQIAESSENRNTETEEAREEAREEIREEEAREEVEELFAEEDESRPNGEQRSSVRISALSVVASTLRTASSSVNVNAGTRSTNVYSGGSSSSYSSNPSNSGNNSAVSSSSGGVSTSSSPSMSDQIASANVQTQQVLSMSSGGTGDITVSISPMPTVDDSPQMVMAEVQVQDMQGDIDTAVSGVMTASEADQVAEQIVAQNIEAQQEQAEEELQETGEYADQSTLVAYLGYVPGFNTYRDVQLQDQAVWYEPRDIYTDVTMNDNTQAFYQLAGTSLNTLTEMVNLQPNL
mgnify:CR=1 FL=1